MVSEKLLQEFIDKWESVVKMKGGRAELRARLKTLQSKPKTGNVQAEIKAIQAILS